MALPPGPPIALSQLIAEFGGGDSLMDFHRDDTYVPALPQNANIPTVGPLSLTQFYGATRATVVVTPPNAQDITEAPPTNPPDSLTLVTNDVVVSGTDVTSATWSFVSGDTLAMDILDNGLRARWYIEVELGGSRSATWRVTTNWGASTTVDVYLEYRF